MEDSMGLAHIQTKPYPQKGLLRASPNIDMFHVELKVVMRPLAIDDLLAMSPQ